MRKSVTVYQKLFVVPELSRICENVEKRLILGGKKRLSFTAIIEEPACMAGSLAKVQVKIQNKTLRTIDKLGIQLIRNVGSLHKAKKIYKETFSNKSLHLDSLDSIFSIQIPVRLS